MTRRVVAGMAMVALLGGLAGCGSEGSASASGPTTTLPNTIGQPSCATTSHQVDLVVQPSPTKIYNVCVGFHGPSISAADVLAKSCVQIATKTYRFGSAICQVAHVPAHYSDCLPTGPMFWAVFARKVGDSWSTAPDGLSTTLYPNNELGLRYDSTSGSPDSPGSEPVPGASPPG